VRLVMLNSPYRIFVEPLLGYINEVAQLRQANETITIVVPEFISSNPMAALLHTNTATLLRSQLKRVHNLVVIDVPYHVN
jgi:hypothetical protein